MAQQPDISQILAALAQQPSGATPSGTPQIPTPQPPNPYPPAGMPSQPPSAPQSYLPQPSNTGSVDLSAIKPVSSGSVSIADAIAKAKSIAADRGVPSFDPRTAPPRDDPRLGGRGYQRSRSRSPHRRDNYGSNPYRDERREDPRRSGSRRSPSPDHGFRGSRGDTQGGYRSNEDNVETIRVKSSLVGLIIGRNGENLRKVESESGCRVQFIQAKEPGAVERQCTLTGSVQARESAKSAIFAIVEENGGQHVSQEKGAYTAGMPGRAKVNLPELREGENSTQIMVPDKTVGLIIGRGGETIKDLQERSGCHVNIVGENKSLNGLRPVNLIGSDRATAMAKELILEIVESDNRGGPAAPAGGNRERPVDAYSARGANGPPSGGRDQIEKSIHVPSEAVGMIIGKGGETIKDMQRSTGCKINVNQPERPDINRKIDLSGSASALAEAERIIWEKVRTVQERDAAAGRQPRGGQEQRTQNYDQSYGQYQPPAQQQAQAPTHMPAFQMPGQAAPQQQQTTDPNDPYAAYGGQAAWYAQWYAALAAQQQQTGQQGGAPQ
ncbi:Hypothetical protein R9X50_00704600 [Acrodontium crateriforme]|uniref:K Homology domain-containing protein n=1 Tax=Acrodontium crateriforme TaxID=150365 RepID=A0AAQ3M9J4_9PEZI|nr:Hypothetical protein R9X50_00704600 [Acrodontium crateriforme]